MQAFLIRGVGQHPRGLLRRYAAVAGSTQAFPAAALPRNGGCRPTRAMVLRLYAPVLSSVRNYGSSVPCMSDFPPHTLFPMPALSPTMETGTIASWNLREGDEFIAGDVLCSIETDKASMDFEAQDDGILAKILREGSAAQDIAVGTPICVVVEEVEDAKAFANFVPEADEPTPAPAPPVTEINDSITPPAAAAGVPNREVSSEFALLPSARHLSQSRGVDATVLTGTGKGGRITKGDVLQALAQGASMPPLAKAAAAPTASSPATAAPSPPPTSVKLEDLEVPQVVTTGSFEDVPNNNMRKIIARRLTESKSQVPHFYTSMEVELDEVMKLRKSMAKNHDIKVSVNDLIIRSSALALRDVPEVNATFNPSSGQVKLQDTIDISVAVATPTGLITPIVPATDKKGLAEITDMVRDLAGRAREGKLQPHEYQGGTFCISNLGMFGIDEFSAVINPPQAAILAVGGGTKRIVPSPYVDGAEEQPKPVIRTIMTARLSADRRVVDEATASLFMSAFREYLSKPELLHL